MVKNLCAFSSSQQSIPKFQPPNPATPRSLLPNSQYPIASAACDSNSSIAIEEIKTLFEATQQLKATLQGQATIIVTLTAHAFSEERLGMLEVGCDEFVPKPFRKDILRKTIAEYSIVQYVYDKQEQFTTPQLPQNRAVFTPRALAVKPRAWLAQLHRTAESCNEQEIFTIIEQIPEQQMALKLGSTSCHAQRSRSVLRRSKNENSSLLTPDFWLLTPIFKTALHALHAQQRDENPSYSFCLLPTPTENAARTAFCLIFKTAIHALHAQQRDENLSYSFCLLAFAFCLIFKTALTNLVDNFRFDLNFDLTQGSTDD
ncbi:MAG: hypothetical protein Fur006_44730 [Coleofasciculaceae cyanobacterium]